MIRVTMAALLMAYLWATCAPSEATCFDCGGACGDALDCMSGCDCYFPEDDDNHHYGRCA